MKGRDVLYALCDAERDRHSSSPLAGTPAREVARRVGGKDGRSVTARLARLEDVGFVRRVHPTLPRWASTQRGREVEELLSTHDKARDRFERVVPVVNYIEDLTERLALSL